MGPTLSTIIAGGTSLAAYIDPGAGSMILQLMLGGIAGAIVFGKLLWTRVKSRFDRPKKDDEDGASS